MAGRRKNSGRKRGTHWKRGKGKDFEEARKRKRKRGLRAQREREERSVRDYDMIVEHEQRRRWDESRADRSHQNRRRNSAGSAKVGYVVPLNASEASLNRIAWGKNPKRNRRKNAGGGHLLKKDATWYGDSAALNGASSLGGSVKHLGFGDFRVSMPGAGNANFTRTQSVAISGQVGRAHRLSGGGVSAFVSAARKAGWSGAGGKKARKSTRTSSVTPMNAATLHYLSELGTVASVVGALRDNLGMGITASIYASAYGGTRAKATATLNAWVKHGWIKQVAGSKPKLYTAASKRESTHKKRKSTRKSFGTPVSADEARSAGSKLARRRWKVNSGGKVSRFRNGDRVGYTPMPGVFGTVSGVKRGDKYDVTWEASGQTQRDLAGSKLKRTAKRRNSRTTKRRGQLDLFRGSR